MSNQVYVQGRQRIQVSQHDVATGMLYWASLLSAPLEAGQNGVRHHCV